MTTDHKRKPHLGRNMKRIRTTHGVSQEALATKLGLEWNQKKISQLEAQEEIETEVLAKVASALNLSPDDIKDFDENGTTYNNTQNNYEGSNNTGANSNVDCVFNPLDELLLMVKKNQQLNDELVKEKERHIELQGRILKEQEARIKDLQLMLEKMKGGTPAK